MNIRTFFYAAVAATGLTALGSTDAAMGMPVDSSFNDRALSALFSESCQAQSEYRRRQMQPVLFKSGTAAAYKNQGHAFVIQSPAFGESMKDEADSLFSKVPGHVKALAFNEGGVFVWPRYGMAEALSMRRHNKNGYITPGLYLSQERRLYVPFMLADVRKNQHGHYEPAFFYSSRFHRTRIMNHETGHMMDDFLGNYSHEDGRRRRPDRRLTNRDDFRQAFDRDARALSREKLDIGHINYYFLSNAGGVRSNVHRTRREVFAELWAEAAGQDQSHLSDYYPETYSVVKSYYDHLEDVYKASGMPCIYEKNGTATAPAFS